MCSEHWFKSHMREIPQDDCLELLQGQDVGRMVFADDTGPLALPVNFSVARGTVLVATSPYGSIAKYATKGPVAFEVDESDEYTESGWSVLIRGTASVVPHSDLRDSHEEPPYSWPEGTRTLVLRITPRDISGRRLLGS